MTTEPVSRLSLKSGDGIDKEVGKGEAIIVDTGGRLKTAVSCAATLPALKTMKPGSAGPECPVSIDRL